MSDDENQWKWNKFVELGNTIHKMRGQVRILEAKRALILAEELLEARVITRLPIKDQQLYETLLPKIACYLDGNAEVIQDAVEKYFFARHCKAGLDENLFQVSFAPKKSGIQTGFICDISDGGQTTRYFIKTHQYGPTEDHLKSMQPPDTKELFIYKLLHHIGIGPEVHFIVPSHGSKMTVYISTKDCHLALLSQLTKDTMNTKALVQLDLISRILCLRDCATNSSNCGQVDGKPMIVDFRIEKQSGGYFKSDILNKFYEGNGEFNYVGLMSTAIGIPQEQKSLILRDSLQEWNLVEMIDEIALEIHPIIQKIVTKVKVDDDIQRYVQDVKETIKVLLGSSYS
jgi:hypothetical protein